MIRTKLKSVLIAFAIVSLLGCFSTEFKGKIEKRKKAFYLVNLSKTKMYQFTIKVITQIKDSTPYYSTSLQKLAPGEEKYLGEEQESVLLASDLDISTDTSSSISTSTTNATIKSNSISGEHIQTNKFELVGQIEINLENVKK